ncbi:cell division protein ZapD [Catenovulum sp. SM1970]|uniref:cell division protein ZapD n=1 Tax=Marinifaba aquimaris TaxID=2741323 RepID=UPI001573310A|nr:cell division protein ZapD [Marinifaba aquimaris]NTS76575.1 cell division protein ZapD [Marinifaba aquimaris]
MACVEYEFPLNEKIRTYLRIEYLINRMKSLSTDLSAESMIGFFEALFAIAEVTERGDLKGDLLKDLEKHEKNLVAWSQHPNIDDSALGDVLQTVMRTTNALQKSGRLGQEIKEDKFLSSIKQRFNIPGGTCCFDLPHLHFWLHQDEACKRQDINNWLGYVEILDNVVSLDLKFVRDRGESAHVTANNGFYQDATENTELLLISVPAESQTYPTVSGNKHRFSIRFMELCNEQGKAASETDISFKLTCC